MVSYLHKRPGRGSSSCSVKRRMKNMLASAVARQKTRGKFEPKIGKMVYAYGRYERLHRATLPISENFYLLMTLDVQEKNFDSILIDKIVPAIAQMRSRFMATDNSISKGQT